MQQFSQVYYLTFMCDSTCSGRLRPSSGAYNRTRNLWFYRWIVSVEELLVVVWQVINLPDHDQQRCNSAMIAAGNHKRM
jgi:hypothetical protein